MVMDYLNGGHWKIVGEFVEVESGKRHENRPKLAEALRICRLHNAKLCIAKIDRLARNVAFIANLMESSVRFVAADMPEANDLTIHVLAAVAQAEAKMISLRTKESLAAARERGVALGRPENLRNHEEGRRKGAEATARKARVHASDLHLVIDDIRASGGTSLRQIAAALNERGIPARSGGAWSATQVSRVLARLS
jgi:DNA invertase Pin-like site-specific DNA recombinase